MMKTKIRTNEMRRNPTHRQMSRKTLFRGLALCLALVAAPSAMAGDLTCKMTYNLTGWSVISTP